MIIFSGNAALFGGIEWYLPNMRGLRLKLEYDTTDYDIEGFPDGDNHSNLHLNQLNGNLILTLELFIL